MIFRRGPGLRLISARRKAHDRLFTAGHDALHETGKKPSAVLSIPDMAVLGAAALLFFGPEQLPRVARKAGNVMREIQNTSQSFIREMERAADMHEQAEVKASTPAPYDPAPYGSTLYDPDGAT